MNKKHIMMVANRGRFANLLYMMYTAISYYENNKLIFKDPIYFDTYFNNKNRLEYKIFNLLPEKVKNVINVSKQDFLRMKTLTDDNIVSHKLLNLILPDNFEHNIYITGYCLNINKIDINIIRDYFKCPDLIKQSIYNYYGDLSNYVCLHVRRSDYIYHKLFILLTADYIESILSNYFPNTPVICVSEDLEWCKENLKEIPNIVFADRHDKNDNFLIDFYIPTFTKSNICSPSSFCMGAALLNSNNDIYVPNPYYLYQPWNEDPELNIIPNYAHLIPYRMDVDNRHILSIK